MTKRTDAAVVDSGDGHLSNSRLHEQMTAGVNDHDLRQKTRKRLEKAGVDPKHLEKLLP